MATSGKARHFHLFGIVPLAAYALLLGVSAFADDSANDSAIVNASINAPAPGSEGDTLTREDARMALLIYKLLDKNGKLKGANISRGKELYYENCKACHGEDGRRLNFGNYTSFIYLGDRAREEIPTFWYQMNFGDENRDMQPYIDELSVEEMVDILGFTQTLP